MSAAESPWQAAIARIRADHTLRDAILRSVQSSMAFSGFEIALDRAEELFEEALSGPELVYEGRKKMYLDALAERIYFLAESDDEPMPKSERLLYRLYALLAAAKGVNVIYEDVHNAWAVCRDMTRPDHPDLVPFDDLPALVKDLDTPYVRAIHNAVKE